MKRLAPTPETDSPSPEPLLAQAGSYLTPAEVDTLRPACAFATEAHAGQNRDSGDAHETLYIYAELAHRLRMWQIKWQLEGLASRCLEPEHYKQIARSLELGRRDEREAYIELVIDLLRAQLENNGVKAEISGRPKHI